VELLIQMVIGNPGTCESPPSRGVTRRDAARSTATPYTATQPRSIAPAAAQKSSTDSPKPAIDPPAAVSLLEAWLVDRGLF